MLTRKIVAEQLGHYLNNQIRLSQLVDWAEKSMIDTELEAGYEKVIMQVLGKIGVADVKDFGLLWEDCESITEQLGFVIKVDLEKAA